MKKLLTHPLFLIGLLLRLILIINVAQPAVTNWYTDFLGVSTSTLNLDPWTAWISNGGDYRAFPYGYGMWFIFLPLVLIAKFFTISIFVAYAFTILIIDIILLFILNYLAPKKDKIILITYWFSPVIIVASYILGLNDLIPALLLVISLLFLKNLKVKLSGIFLAIAISAKLSMITALPFYIIYLFNNQSKRDKIYDFLLSFGVFFTIFVISLVFSDSGIRMLFGNPEMKKVYQLAIELTGSIMIQVIPLAYLLTLYLVWRVRRLNFDLFHSTIGISFLIIALFIPASPGWLIWCIPFLVLYQSKSDRVAIYIVLCFSVLYALNIFLFSSQDIFNRSEFSLKHLMGISDGLLNFLTSFLYTLMVALGVVLVIRMWREAIGKNVFFRLSRKPLVIGIAGDSGSGKDTLTNSIVALFGAHSVVALSGDDYHLWDRQKPIWEVMTHLNPRANDLEGFARDLLSLIDGKNITIRQYNHTTGKTGKPLKVKSNDIIIASGLHALYLPILRKSYNLKIYLDIDENLRKYFKIERDVNQRGHSYEKVLKSFERREPDSVRFIRTQKKYADVILSLQPIHTNLLTKFEEIKDKPRLKLVVKTRTGFNELQLHRILVGLCGLHVDINFGDNGSDIEITIDGEITASDIKMAANILCPNVREFLDTPPQWQEGMMGLIQLITLFHISHALVRNLYNGNSKS